MLLHLIESGRRHPLLSAPALWSAGAHAALAASVVVTGHVASTVGETTSQVGEVVYFLPLLPGRAERPKAERLEFAADVPGLGAGDIRAAMRALREGRDAVFAPAEDGGYLLVGLSHVMPALFEAMPWGTDAVMEETRQRLRNLGWRWLELATRWDVERPEDYQRLVREGGVAPSHP